MASFQTFKADTMERGIENPYYETSRTLISKSDKDIKNH